MELAFVIACLIIFGVGAAALVIWTIKKPTPIKTMASLIFTLVYIAAIIWSIGEFSN